ncbi:clathrin adaptor complex small chain-domain-containing protein [Mycena floridula]|nr:clathrin adaptor complex small chain-domain-containing protein [Mycena floridula]
MINYILLVSGQGKIRLAKWFITMTPKLKAKIVRDVTQLVLARPKRPGTPKLCNFLEYKGRKSAIITNQSSLHGDTDSKIVYQRYAALSFITGIGYGDNELLTLEIMHRYMDILNTYFYEASSLDPIPRMLLIPGTQSRKLRNWTSRIFNFEKAYAILDEVIISGELQDSSRKAVLRVVTQSDNLEEQENAEHIIGRLGS